MTTDTRGEAADFASDECPIDLHYPDEQPVLLDIEAMTRQGKRMRWQRKTVVIGMTTAAIGVLSLAIWAFPASTARPPVTADAANAISATDTGKTNPPSGQVVVLAQPNPDERPAGQSIVAWTTHGNQICFGSIDIADPTNGPLLSCEPAPNGLMSDGLALLPDKPTFRAGPSVAGHILAVGFVRGAASTVSVTMSGSTTTGTVVALGVGTAGGYALWLPTTANSPGSWSAISKVVAEDSSGHVVATLP